MNPTCPATSKAKEDSHPTTTSSPSQRVVLFSVLLPASRQFVLSRADISYSLQAAVSSIRNRESEPESMHITRVFLSYSEKKEENERKKKNKRKRKRQRRIRRKFMSVSILRRNEEFGYRSPTSARLFPFFLFYFFFFLLTSHADQRQHAACDVSYTADLRPLLTSIFRGNIAFGSVSRSLECIPWRLMKFCVKLWITRFASIREVKKWNFEVRK